MTSGDVTSLWTLGSLLSFFFALEGPQSSLTGETLLIYVASSNVITTINETPFDVVIGINESFKLEAVSELLRKYYNHRNKSKSKSLLLMFDELKTIIHY